VDALINTSTDWLRISSDILLLVVAYFLKRAVGDVDKLTDKVGELEKKVAVLVYSDRRKRHEDYDTWDNEGGR
jgi:hypothetical protein